MIEYLKLLFAERAAALHPDGTDPEAERRAELADKVRLGMLLFLISLGVMFAVSLFAYLYIRILSPASPPMGSLSIPFGLWVSTAALAGAGFAIYGCQRAVAAGNIPALRSRLMWTFGLSVAFVIIQVPSMAQLMISHRAALTEFTGIYGLTLALVVIHAFHVLGGLLPLSVLTYKALQDRVGTEHALLVRSCAKYWHFLEGVWVVMFGAFLLAR